MKFARVELLLLIWIVPALVLVYLYGWRKRRRILTGFAQKRTLSRIIPPGMNRRRRIGAALVIAAATCAIFAMSGPQYGFQWQEIERQGIDIVIALDCSRSMLATDIAPTRLDRAKREIYDLLTMLQGDRVGLVAFSGTAFLQCPLTIDYPAFYLFLDVLTPDYLPVGGTDMRAAIESARDAFDPQSEADKAIILITDGEHTGDSSPLETAQAAQKAGIKLFTIGVGSGDGVPVPENQGGFKKDNAGQIILSRMDEALLTRMALATGGSYVRSVAGDMDLEAIYIEQIRAGMDLATVESGRKQVWADRYQWPLALAVLLLMLTRWIPPVKQVSILAALSVGMLVTTPLVAEAGPLQKGYDAYQQEKYDRALEQFVEGQLKAPDDPAVLYNIGNAYYKTGDFEAAKQHYLQSLSKAPPALKPDLLYNLGNSAYRLGALEEAVKNYESALALKPDDPQTLQNLAFVKEQLKKQQQQQQQQQENQNKDQNNQDSSEQDQNKENNQDNKEQQDGNQQQQSQQNKENQDKDSQKPPEYGSSSPEEQKQAPKPEEKEQDKQSEPQQSPAKAQQKKDKAPKDNGSAASQMLNRLKDQPGRAMMPDYQKRTVEKDW